MENALLIPPPPPPDGATADRALSVTLLTRRIRNLLETGIAEVWVAGEISNFRSPGSGHYYFTLKDEEAVLNAVMFRGEAARLKFALQDGQAVIAHGSLTVYEIRGQYQLLVQQLFPRGQGSLQQKFEALKRKLQEEGLFDPDHKKSLPVFPEIIGIVTSLQGAVLQDFLKILKRRAPGIRVQVRGVRVQGNGAAEEIAAAIKTFDRDAVVDVIVVARGGGSLEDLWAFNEEVVARALAACTLPTISAVGHETDFTISDFAADLRAPTPSAAAELVSRDWNDWREEISQWAARMIRAMRGTLELQRIHWQRLRDSWLFREPHRLVQLAQQRVDDLREALRSGLTSVVQEKRHAYEKMLLRWKSVRPHAPIAQAREHLKHWRARLQALGPEGTLRRGYALALDDEGRIIREAKPGLAGTSARILLAKGSLDVKIECVKPPSKKKPD
jgi:exodeoxyribonuclease VII large subunit